METSHMIRDMVCVSLSCTQLWTNKTQHNEVFSILHKLTASFCRTWCRLLNMEAQQHLTHSCNFKINSRSHQCRSMVMKAQCAMKLKLHVSFIFSLEWDKCSVSGSKDTAHSNHVVDPRASYNMMTGSPSTKLLELCFNHSWENQNYGIFAFCFWLH